MPLCLYRFILNVKLAAAISFGLLSSAYMFVP